MRKNIHVEVLGYRWGDIVKAIEEDNSAKTDKGLWRDDRGILINMYNRLCKTFDVLDNIEDNYIHVAVNHAAKADEFIMLDIATRFGYSLPENMQLEK